jgi:hypothetical protein
MMGQFLPPGNLWRRPIEKGEDKPTKKGGRQKTKQNQQIISFIFSVNDDDGEI